jgi:hypothetical protein
MRTVTEAAFTERYGAAFVKLRTHFDKAVLAGGTHGDAVD